MIVPTGRVIRLNRTLGSSLCRYVYPKVVFCVVEKQPHFAVGVRQENLLQWDHVRVLQLPQKLQDKNPGLLWAISHGVKQKIKKPILLQSLCRLTWRYRCLQSAWGRSLYHPSYKYRERQSKINTRADCWPLERVPHRQTEMKDKATQQQLAQGLRRGAQAALPPHFV